MSRTEPRLVYRDNNIIMIFTLIVANHCATGNTNHNNSKKVTATVLRLRLSLSLSFKRAH